MSKKGQLLRGEKWFLMNRDKNGVVLPSISKDKEKMVDVNVYLAEVNKDVEETKSKRKK